SRRPRAAGARAFARFALPGRQAARPRRGLRVRARRRRRNRSAGLLGRRAGILPARAARIRSGARRAAEGDSRAIAVGTRDVGLSPTRKCTGAYNGMSEEACSLLFVCLLTWLKTNCRQSK